MLLGLLDESLQSTLAVAGQFGFELQQLLQFGLLAGLGTITAHGFLGHVDSCCYQ